MTGGAASAGIADLLGGPRLPATVLGVFPAAVYLAVGEHVVAVVSRDGVHHPNAVVLAAPAAAGPFDGLAVGAVGRVGDRTVEVAGLSVRVTRWWQPRPRLPVLAPATRRVVAGDLAARLAKAAPLPADLAQPLAAVARRLQDGDPAGAVDLARDRLLGRGPGLTPAGDDLLAGLGATAVAGAVAAQAPASLAADVTSFGARVADAAAGRTTSVSAALLRHAAAGQTCDVVARLLGALPDPSSRAGALDELLRVGGTSGRDLAHGVVAGLRLLAARPTDDRPRLHAPAVPA